VSQSSNRDRGATPTAFILSFSAPRFSISLLSLSQMQKKSTRVRPRLSFGLLAIFHPCHSMRLIAVYHLAGEKFVLTKRDGVYLTWMRRQTRRTRIRGPAIFLTARYGGSTHSCANIISHFHRSSDEIAAKFHNVTAFARTFPSN